VFNFEGGCYAKCVDLSAEKEPQIFNAIKFGSLLENINFYDGTTTVDYANITKTENTRVSYPANYIENAVTPAVGDLPKNIFFLTCDAYGILPPISKLTTEQAMYHFISGYTAKVAGTEMGITEPTLTFSACFGKAFLPLHPAKYATLLGEKLKKNKVNVWLLNTGWVGGRYGVGSRIKLSYTRALINAALSGDLDKVEYGKTPCFNLKFPKECVGVPSEILEPRNAWKDKSDFDKTTQNLAASFLKNFEQYASGTSADILAAAPLLAVTA
jgi:phosphoenolpyruvate carboxykinase (ATP)